MRCARWTVRIRFVDRKRAPFIHLFHSHAQSAAGAAAASSSSASSPSSSPSSSTFTTSGGGAGAAAAAAALYPANGGRSYQVSSGAVAWYSGAMRTWCSESALLQFYDTNRYRFRPELAPELRAVSHGTHSPRRRAA